MKLLKIEIEIAVFLSVVSIICFFLCTVFNLLGIDLPVAHDVNFYKEMKCPYFYSACIFLACFSYLCYFSLKAAYIFYIKIRQHRILYLLSIPVIIVFLCIYSPFLLPYELAILSKHLGLWISMNFLGCALTLCFMMSLIEDFNNICYLKQKFHV
ncbi:MAG TPA: hypothetical protein QF753_21825 [Victivallales bacterium]|nr:hypothetical protein [Victivallales bacterium]